MQDGQGQCGSPGHQLLETPAPCPTLKQFFSLAQDTRGSRSPGPGTAKGPQQLWGGGTKPAGPTLPIVRLPKCGKTNPTVGSHPSVSELVPIELPAGLSHFSGKVGCLSLPCGAFKAPYFPFPLPAWCSCAGHQPEGGLSSLGLSQLSWRQPLSGPGHRGHPHALAVTLPGRWICLCGPRRGFRPEKMPRGRRP